MQRDFVVLEHGIGAVSMRNHRIHVHFTVGGRWPGRPRGQWKVHAIVLWRAYLRIPSKTVSGRLFLTKYVEISTYFGRVSGIRAFPPINILPHESPDTEGHLAPLRVVFVAFLDQKRVSGDFAVFVKTH